MKKFLLLILLLTVGFQAVAQPLSAYEIYNKKGRKISVNKMIRKLSNYDVVLFGEHHNNNIIHWLELEITKRLAKKRMLTLGAEMFEQDNQAYLSKYIQGTINEKTFKDSVRLWGNYETDYKPLVEFAKENNINFIATNTPRRYASIVAKKGIDSLENISAVEKKFFVPLPYTFSMETPGYKEMETMFSHTGSYSMTNFIKAQALKDATMAYFIAENLEDNKLFVHYNGNFHSKEYGGIYWYLKEKKPHLKIAVISIFIENIPSDKSILTDFNLVIPALLSNQS